MKLHDFLLEHAKFPFPHPDELLTADATDISEIEIGLLEREWKAKHAVRDDSLIQKLCRSLEKTLGDTPLTAGSEDYFLESFWPLLQVDQSGTRNREWNKNASKAHTRTLLDKGFFEAARKCLGNFGFGPYTFETAPSSRVDYIFLVNDKQKLLPPHGIQLKWLRGQTLVPKVLSTAALHLGLRQMEWMFLTCHNYWIVCRLVRDDDHPYLAYSSEISIKDSSEPFRAFLGAILSGAVGVPVESSAYSSDMELDTIEEGEDEGPLPEHDIDDDRSRAHDEHENTESRLIVTSSSPNSPDDFQVWVHLHRLSNNTPVFPACARSKQRLWLTRFIASGSTGNVWECRFDNCDDLFAVKIVEVLRPSDAGSRQRLHNEFNVYLTLDKAYQSGQLCDRIAPCCYGAFKGNHVDVLILDLCDGILNDWEELSAPER
ncbi:hypothetical protein M378DRAFT_91869 [Amanita muscaria Koide BX008]|uniref:Uncharacterized protein n=1 Tax=Amanita muscaria (strain Koide BX008) TaxID=946122 RepID=A0A0C2RWY4_AMAMK|nr:hypothetical protein M378DRAFT_91869 [Amanita muscaria Koide BX008]